MEKIRYKAVLAESWNLTQKNFGMLVAVVAPVIVLGFFFNRIPVVFQVKGTLLEGGIMALGSAVQAFFTIGVIRCVLSAADGKKISFFTLFSGMDVFLNFLVISLGYYVVIIFGLLLLIVPGVIWMLKFFFVYYLSADKGTGIRAAFRQSAVLTRGHKAELFGLVAIQFVINMAGFLCFGIGLLVTIPWTSMMSALVYRQLERSQGNGSEICGADPQIAG